MTGTGLLTTSPPARRPALQFLRQPSAAAAQTAAQADAWLEGLPKAGAAAGSSSKQGGGGGKSKPKSKSGKKKK